MKEYVLLMTAVSILLISGCISGITDDSVCIEDKCFSVEVAATAEERSIGLMDRESMAADNGMLFVFDEEDRYSFWMKNTLIPLDIIWISDDMRIVHIIMDAQPCPEDGPCASIDPPADAKYVLEVNSGKSHGLNIGDSVTINADI
jgi:uncharacterized membrane protein (UPF0127 family)